MFSLYYKKNNNNLLFSQFENNGFLQIQNYIPLYSEFFKLSDVTYSLINLNHKHTIYSIKDTYDNNKFLLDVKSKNKKNEEIVTEKTSFFKFSPLLNPLKYLTGRYKTLSSQSDLMPTFKPILTKKNNYLKKLHDINNTSYVDGFFSYLSSKLLNNHDFIFGNDYYGSFIGVQGHFNVNVYDDLDYLHQSSFFHKNKGEMFDVENFDLSLLDDDTRKYRETIVMEDIEKDELKIDEFDGDSFNKVFELTEQNIEKLNAVSELSPLTDNIVDEKIKNKNRSESDLSSNSETTSNISELESGSDDSDIETESDDGEEEGEEEDEEEEGEEEESDGSNQHIESCTNSEISEYSSSINENVNCVIHKFPVQIICMEQMDETLDDYIENNEMSDMEWKSCLIQVMFILTTYQKCFDFTHNDLHTNNIMYVNTDKKYIYVKYNNQYYKVPTFGKIYKIIDFGRAIYKYKGKQLCSDSYNFKSKEDAANQYNFEPYRNYSKPEILPNKSFDLCRLGCSLYDYFIEDFTKEDDEKNDIIQLIIKWTRDDKERNILYKKNGDERYPEFKLYKMIARTVHHCEPPDEVKNPMFDCFKISKKKVSNKTKVNNIDEMPIYV